MSPEAITLCCYIVNSSANAALFWEHTLPMQFRRHNASLHAFFVGLPFIPFVINGRTWFAKALCYLILPSNCTVLIALDFVGKTRGLLVSHAMNNLGIIRLQQAIALGSRNAGTDICRI